MAATKIVGLGLRLVDGEAIRGNVLVHIYADPAQTLTQLQTAATAFIQAVDAVTDMKIVGAHANMSLTLPTYGTDEGDIKAAAAGDADDVGVLDYSQAGVPFHYGFAIPGIAAAVQSGGAIVTASGAVLALTDLLTGAVLGGNYVGNNNDALTALYRSFLADRKHRRQSFSKSVRFA